MASKKLGTKRHCQSCDGKFYDLNKPEIVCPSCGTVFDPEVLLKSRRSKPVAPAAASKAETSGKKAIDSDELDDDINEVDDDADTDDNMLDDDADLIVVKGDDDDDEAVKGSDDADIDVDLDDDQDDDIEDEG
jgi:uncharacterized protein (TIGR02300 family)